MSVKWSLISVSASKNVLKKVDGSALYSSCLTITFGFSITFFYWFLELVVLEEVVPVYFKPDLGIALFRGNVVLPILEAIGYLAYV